MTIASSEAIKQAVAAGLGISVLSKHSLDFGIMPGIKIINAEHFPIRSKWRLVQNASRQPTILANAFHTFMVENGVDILASAVQNSQV